MCKMFFNKSIKLNFAGIHNILFIFPNRVNPSQITDISNSPAIQRFHSILNLIFLTMLLFNNGRWLSSMCLK